MVVCLRQQSMPPRPPGLMPLLPPVLCLVHPIERPSWMRSGTVCRRTSAGRGGGPYRRRVRSPSRGCRLKSPTPPTGRSSRPWPHRDLLQSRPGASIHHTIYRSRGRMIVRGQPSVGSECTIVRDASNPPRFRSRPSHDLLAFVVQCQCSELQVRQSSSETTRS